MTLRGDDVYLQDIIESIDYIFQHLQDMTEYEFTNNILVQDAVIRRFEINGEASAKINSSFKEQHKNIEWSLMKDMRNKLSHEYFGISSITIYQTCKSHLPLLKQKIEKIIKG